jgi:arsenate reductase
VAAQIVGGALGFGCVLALYPGISDVNEQVVVPHGHEEELRMTGVPEVLFVCVHNAGRSQIAAALLDHHAQGRVRVRSAGSAPAAEINPAVIAALSELGIDVTKEFPKPLTDEAARAADVIVTMGCGDACPVYPGKRYLDWQLQDPAGQSLEFVRTVRDDIDARVRTLLEELAPSQAGARWRRKAMVDQTSSTTPNGHAPERNP